MTKRARKHAKARSARLGLSFGSAMALCRQTPCTVVRLSHAHAWILVALSLPLAHEQRCSCFSANAIRCVSVSAPVVRFRASPHLVRQLNTCLHPPPLQIVADLLNRSIFDLAIERAGYPYLPAEPRELDDIKLQQVGVGHAY